MLNTLTKINYYRLSAYLLPFKKDVSENFKKDTTFEQVYLIYEFDKKLRHLIADAIEDVEISFRTHITYHLSHTYNAFGYLDKTNFNPQFNHIKWLSILNDKLKYSKEVFIEHHRSSYDVSQGFPIWKAIEVTSFSMLSNLFWGLKNTDRQNISRNYYSHDQIIIKSWLFSLVYVRNLCAHHSRLWNRDLSISPKKPQKDIVWKSINPKDIHKLFTLFLMLKVMLNSSDKFEEFRDQFKKLLLDYQKIDTAAMGFPRNWEDLLK
ncbi:MAG: Abi family protein [Candidatus Margulisiibacteriota bacterium]